MPFSKSKDLKLSKLCKKTISHFEFVLIGKFFLQLFRIATNISDAIIHYIDGFFSPGDLCLPAGLGGERGALTKNNELIRNKALVRRPVTFFLFHNFIKTLRAFLPLPQRLNLTYLYTFWTNIISLNLNLMYFHLKILLYTAICVVYFIFKQQQHLVIM